LIKRILKNPDLKDLNKKAGEKKEIGEQHKCAGLSR